MLEIRSLEAADRGPWQQLWDGYLHFYRQHLPPEVTDATFARLIEPDVQPYGLVARRHGALIGFAHYLFHPSSWSLQPLCYLEDLFVDTKVRGSGVGRALIQAVYAAADEAQAANVYWLTQEFNAPARALYDTLAHRTSFIRYER